MPLQRQKNLLDDLMRSHLPGIKQDIARIAIDTHENVDTILWKITKELTQTDWQQFCDEDTEYCRCCRKVVRYCDISDIFELSGAYLCPECAAQPGREQQCTGCHRHFSHRHFQYTRHCYECDKSLCCLCFEAGEGILCKSCRSRYHIQGDWAKRELLKVIAAKSRVREFGMKPDLDLRQWIQTLAFFNWQCAYCQEQPYIALEHFVPVTLNGNTSQSNCVPSCTRCNRRKGHNHPDRPSGAPREDIERVRAYLAQFK